MFFSTAASVPLSGLKQHINLKTTEKNSMYRRHLNQPKGSILLERKEISIEMLVCEDTTILLVVLPLSCIATVYYQ